SERELLRDEASEARAENVRALDVQSFEQRGRVVCVALHRYKLIGLVRARDAARVERDDAKLFRERRNLPIPNPKARAEARHEQQRLARAILLVVKTDVSDLNFRHL